VKLLLSVQRAGLVPPAYLFETLYLIRSSQPGYPSFANCRDLYGQLSLHARVHLMVGESQRPVGLPSGQVRSKFNMETGLTVPQRYSAGAGLARFCRDSDQTELDHRATGRAHSPKEA
jgi:hypothetical protein